MYKELSFDEKMALGRFTDIYNHRYNQQMTPLKYYNYVIKNINTGKYSQESINKIYFANSDCGFIKTMYKMAESDKTATEVRKKNKHVNAVMTNLDRNVMTYSEVKHYLTEKFKDICQYGVSVQCHKTKITVHPMSNVLSKKGHPMYYPNRIYKSVKMSMTPNRIIKPDNIEYYEDEVMAIEINPEDCNKYWHSPKI